MKEEGGGVPEGGAHLWDLKSQVCHCVLDLNCSEMNDFESVRQPLGLTSDPMWLQQTGAET